MTLGELQRAFARFLLEGDDSEVAPRINADWFEPAERLAIYRNNFLISLAEALAANFPVTTEMLGRDFMRQVARQFVLANPPKSPRIVEYGSAFPGFLASRDELRDYPYVPEMAAFEWMRIRAWDAETQRCLGPSDLGAMEPGELARLRVKLARHVGVLGHTYRLAELFAAHQRPDARLEDIDMTPEPRHSLVCRSGTAILVRSLTPAQASFLRSLESPRDLGPAIEAAFPEAVPEASQMVGLALQHGLLVTAASAPMS